VMFVTFNNQLGKIYPMFIYLFSFHESFSVGEENRELLVNKHTKFLLNISITFPFHE